MGEQVLTKEEWPRSFLILSPTSQSHTAPVLSTEHENSILREEKADISFMTNNFDLCE